MCRRVGVGLGVLGRDAAPALVRDPWPVPTPPYPRPFPPEPEPIPEPPCDV
jgi:hypothetical protein